MNDVRLGVFICECGDQIASILDLETLERGAAALPGVVTARRLAYSCSPDGLAAIRSACAQDALDRVLVAGCTTRTMGSHFRTACAQAGVDDRLFELVDIREGCAWVHHDEPAMATGKALDLIRMGAARLALRRPNPPVSGAVAPGTLVIGGGITGMTAALALANSNQPVTLVERETELGGMLRDAHTLYPNGHSAARFLAEKVQAVANHPGIELMLGNEVTDVSGTVGQYTVRVDGQSPFEVGAIIVATGAGVLTPQGQFHYDGRRVVTQLDFERELCAAAPGAPASSVVMILCAGQRDETVRYCSGVCCMGALNQALQIKKADPEARVTILFRELYLLGEDLYQQKVLDARHAGVEFIRYTPSCPPEVTAEAVEVRDQESGCEVRLPCDRVVLATPLVPQAGASVLAHMLNIAQDEDGFFPELRLRLRPGDYAERGIYVCGAAHHPTGREEAQFQATDAAFRALRYVRAGQVTSRAPFAVVDDKLCTGCGACVSACPFGAISMHEREGALDLSQVDPLLCTGCGNCVVVCPVKAISQPLDSDDQVLAQIDAVLASPAQNGRPRILALGCEWSGYAAAELAGANRLSYPADVRLIRTRCSARFDPTLILWALFRGADGVFLGACPPGECHYVNGNKHALERFETLRNLLLESGFDPRRVQLEWISPDDPHDFVTRITAFTKLVKALGPSPVLAK